jgi:LuxR family maltose regulon positive regulatory protein
MSPENLLQTKLFTPALRGNLVTRARLLDKLDHGLSPEIRLSLISAPAGFGKTTLVAEWLSGLEKDQRPGELLPCWLSLDEGDDDPTRFMSYLVAAFEKAGKSREAGSLLRSFPPPPFQTLLGVLVNELLEGDKVTFLVIDDYQFISNPAIHEGMAFFLDHLPQNFHLIMVTRSDPPLPLARLRARGQLVEIRADDLQFTLEETAQLIHAGKVPDLSEEELSRLVERTEGWVVGLQMAALALRSQPNPALFVRNFSGSHRYILDYLVEEVLRHQPRHIQDFLFQTSILVNLSGPLCDAVTGIPSSGAEASGQQTLEYLERSNLFLVPLDPERRWYRYHHLFADLLRTRLEQKTPRRLSELHLRASAWYEQNEMLPEAVDHALAGKEFDLATRLIEGRIEQLLAENGLPQLLGWIRRIPPDFAAAHPWLCIARAWSAMFTNDAARTGSLLQAAELSIRPGDPPGLRNAWLGHIACLRAFLADIHGDAKETIDQAQLALVTYRLENRVHRAFARYMLGRAYFIQGLFPQAIETFLENIDESIRAEATTIFAPTLSILARIYRIEGRLSEAERRLQAGLAQIEAWDPPRVTVAGMAYAGMADLRREHNELEAAEELARRSVELCGAWANPSALCVCYISLLRVVLARGYFPAAEEAFRQAEEVLRGHNTVAEMSSDLDAARVRLWLATGQASKAFQWSQAQVEKEVRQAPFSIPRERQQITIARGLIAGGEFEPARRILTRLAEAAKSGNRFGHLIEVLNLQALAFQAAGDSARALPGLQESLALAEPEKYLRIYLDEGEPMRELLQAVIRAPASPAHKACAQRILAAFAGADQAGLPEARRAGLIEPLTGRELDVLRLLVEGLSNRQIAGTLVLSEGTVKFHVHNLLEKLGVRSRSEAIARARKETLL